jgi:hypothetical protein
MNSTVALTTQVFQFCSHSIFITVDMADDKKRCSPTFRCGLEGRDLSQCDKNPVMGQAELHRAYGFCSRLYV